MSVSPGVSVVDSLDFTFAPSQHMAGNTLRCYAPLALTTFPVARPPRWPMPTEYAVHMASAIEVPIR